MQKERLLFICTSNTTRSPTCEDILRYSPLYETKSAGTAPHAIVRVDQAMIDWADRIFVMCERTDKHLSYLREHFSLADKPVIDLDLPDFIYTARDEPGLIHELTARLTPHITLKMPYDQYRKLVPTCPFCARDRNRSLKETSAAYVTYALAPYHKHHLLVTPKRHASSLDDLDQDTRQDIESLQQWGLTVLKRLGYESITLLVREGNATNKSVEHVHFHIIPHIRVGDLDHLGNERQTLDADEIETTIRDILSAAQAL